MVRSKSPPTSNLAWEAIGSRGAADRAEAWEERLGSISERKQAEFARIFDRDAPKRLAPTIRALKKQMSEEQPKGGDPRVV